MYEPGYQKRYEKTQRKWDKLKHRAKCCPDCFCENVGLNESHLSKWKRFYLECENCHWCGDSYPTIKMAIRNWNRQLPPSADLYKDEKYD